MLTREQFQSNLAKCRTCTSSRLVDLDGRRTRVCKHDDKPILPHANRGVCAENLLATPPKDEPGMPFGKTLICQSGVHCGVCRQPEGGRDWRREQRKKFKVPGGITDFNCPHGKPWIGARSGVKIGNHYIVVNRQGAGDAIALTAAIRDLHLAHPHRFVIGVRGNRSEIFQYNPYVTPEAKVAGDPKQIAVRPRDYAKWQHRHMTDAFRDSLGHALGVKIPTFDIAGDVHLSGAEMAEPPEVPGPYWLIFAGGKADFTVKWWPWYQALVDILRGKVHFVRVGHGGWQPPLTGVTSLVGATRSHRRLIKLMYHAQGGLGPVSYGMHLAAAVPTPDATRRPYVVVAGGGETPAFYQYTGHVALHTIGQLPCCQSTGCWKYKAQPIAVVHKHDPLRAEWHGGDCVDRVFIGDVGAFGRCMTMVTAEMAAEAVLKAIDTPRTPRPPLVLPPPPPDPRTAHFHALWRELHARPFVSNTVFDGKWMNEFTKRLPCGECREHWKLLLKQMPPVYHPEPAYHAWTVEAHNAVNRRLGKPVFTVAQARLMERA
jgi:hypothetical protein